MSLILAACGSPPRDGMMVNVDGHDGVFLEGLHPGDVLGHPDSAEWKVVPPLDTADLLSSMFLKEASAVLDSSAAADTAWYVEEDTIVVRYVAYACTYPDHDLVDTARFPGIKGFYVEPASAALAIPWRMQVSGKEFELIGRRSRHLYPATESMGPPTPGYGFRYRSYRILLPYQVWGPHVLDPELYVLDSIWGPSLQLTVN